MSAYTEVQLEITDLSVLKDVLKEMGYNIQEHKEPQNLRGYRGDVRQQKAHIIVPKEQLSGASNDIGFLRIDGKFKLIISEFDRRVKRIREQFLDNLNKEYGIAKLKKQCHQMGMMVIQQQKMNDGRVKIKVRSLS